MDVLRFITAGSIDDGKSTLIGRLLLDTKNIKDDILGSVSAGDDGRDINLAFITDGLRAERQAGITIDVAYKYFATLHRKYIITDAPGHFQYTKNLVSGASAADAIIILIDAVNGISSQTRRHSKVASFLKIRNIVVAINKMDAVGYDRHVFTAILEAYKAIAAQLVLPSVTFIPMSALNGDNVTTPSANMPWYTGKTLMQYLEDCAPRPQNRGAAVRMPVQYVQDNYSYGKVISGTIMVGDKVRIYPDARDAFISSLFRDHEAVEYAEAGQDACISFEEGVTLQRGDMIAGIAEPPRYADELEAELCWLDDVMPLTEHKEYILRLSAAECRCRVVEIVSKNADDNFISTSGHSTVSVNEFAMVKIKTANKVASDSYAAINETGRAILIDPETNNTSGALIIR